MRIKEILEEKEVYKFLESRNLLVQYKKVKLFLLGGYSKSADFKKRKPKKEGIYCFRINKQYRAIGYFREDDVFIVVEIYDHQ